MEKILGAEEERRSRQVSPKARGLAQYGGPPGWLVERDPAGCDFVRDGRSMPPALTDHTTCRGVGEPITTIICATSDSPIE